MPFFAVLIGLLAAVIFYSSTVASYKKAGAGQTYRIESSTDVKLNRRLDSRAGTRSRVDHGFYSGSVSASGRSQAYHMPGSLKNTIEQALSSSAAHAAQQKPAPQPKPGTQQDRPRPPFGPMSSSGRK